MTLDITNLSYDSVNKSFGITAANTVDMFFKSDGLSIYSFDATDVKVYLHTLSSAWDLSTLSENVNSKFVNAEVTNPSGLFFKPDGLIMYVSGSTDQAIYQYTLSSAWDVTTASYASKSLDTSGQSTTNTHFQFKPDGTKLFVVGDSTGNKLFEYDLSSAWDISTASYNSVFLSTTDVTGGEKALRVSDDGLQLFILNNGTAGGVNSIIYQYSMSSVWDLSTATYDSKSADINSEDTAPRALFFKDDETKLYYFGSTSDLVYQYSTVPFGPTAEPLILTASLIATPAISVPVPVFSLSTGLSAGTFLGIIAPTEPLIAAGALSAGVKSGPTAGPLTAVTSLAGTPAISVPVPTFSVSTALSAELPTVFTREFSDIYYIFTLTGAEDSTTDIEIPISNFQTRLRDGDPTFLQVTVPDSDSWLSAINVRSNGELRVDMAFKRAGVFIRRDTIASADLEQIDPISGPISQSILLSGHKTESFSSKAITVPLGNAGVRSVNQGVLSYRLAVPEINLKPGDTVTIGADTFTANIITYFISVDARYMTVSE